MCRRIKTERRWWPRVCATRWSDSMLTEHTAPVDEQTSLFYRAWLPPNSRKAVVMVHRGHEHSGRLIDVVDDLALQDTAVFAWDARGHGKSPGDRGYAPSFSRIVR